MTGFDAQVVLLASRRRRNPAPEVTCQCTPSFECYSHRVARLADRLRAVQAIHAHELLITADVLETVVADAVSVLDGIADATLSERTAR